MTPTTSLPYIALKKKLRLDAQLVFDTAWRIGSGREGPTSDLGVLLDAQGLPLLPGSSLKGKLRSTCEALASALGLSACLLDSEASGRPCASDVEWFKRHRQEHQQAIRQGPSALLRWIETHTCDVCKLFGSPVQAARLRVSDGRLERFDPAAIRVRDGVVLDRDSHTAVDGLKYDYETVAAGTTFRIRVELDNPTPQDEGLFGAALFDWHAGSMLGGFTSRGLGRFHLENIALSGVDFSNPQERLHYLTCADPEKKLSSRGDWQTYFQERIRAIMPQPTGE
jgi:CRISPR-associated protein Csm3